jgi:hypothetical protein
VAHVTPEWWLTFARNFHIEGKVEEHNAKHGKTEQIFGVYQGKEIEHIEAYLQSGAIYKKILTTPEGFVTKVVPAFEDDIDIMLKEYFMLFDECERIITDVSYRGDIAAPIDFFFRFDQKAMVSATVLPFSDCRFDDFEHIVIVPKYDYSKPIMVVNTNNVLASIKRHLEEINSEHIEIFCNSTNTIFAIIDAMNIRSSSKVHCARDSINSLNKKGYFNATYSINTEEMSKYNFYTSRFFSAVDIKVDYKPDVIMVTDVFFAQHSILDPLTEVIQIAGRFRNGIKSLTHIANFDDTLTSKTEHEAHYYLQGCFDTYQNFLTSYDKETHPGARESFLCAIKASPVHNFYSGGKVNYFMVDNFIHEERVKGYYQRPGNLKAVYQSQHKHFKTTFKSEHYPLGDHDRLRRESKLPKKDLYRLIANQYDKVAGFYVMDMEGLKYRLRNDYPLITKAYDLIKLDGLEATGYVTSNIRKAIAEAEKKALLRKLSETVFKSIEANKTHLHTDITNHLSRIYIENDVTEKASPKHILRYFKGRDTTSNGKHAYVLYDRKDLDAE